ncbi:hypothetical protein Tco_0943820 [Tanacetum coccineum]
MPYLRFTKVIINHFISKDKTICMRNKINIHTVRDDTLLGTLKFVSKTKDYQKYGALIPDGMINQDIKDSKAYKTYLDFSTGKATPKKASKFKKVASPSKKLSPVLEEEHAEKPKRAKKPAKKSTTAPTAGMDLLSKAALLKAAQLKKTLKKRKLENHKLHASGSGDGVGSQPKVPDESEDKRTSTDEGSGTKPGVPNVSKYQPKSENESWRDSKDDDNDDDSDDASNDDDDDDDDDDVDSDVGGDNEASNSEKTNSDKDENPNLNQNEEEEEEEYKEEYVRTPDSYGFIDEDEEYEELYKDVNVRLKDTKHEEGGKGDAKMTDDGRADGTQHTTYEQVKDDEHVILTIVHNTQKTKVPLQSSSISSDFANQFLNLDNVSPIDSEVISTMNVKVRHEEPSTQTPPLLTIHVTVIPETSIAAAPTIPLTIPSITSLSQQSTPTPTPTTEPTTTSIPILLDFSSLFGFNQRVSVLERDLSQLKQVDYFAQLLETIKSQIPAIVDAQLNTRLEDSIQKSFRTITESLKNVVLSKSSSQPKSTYEAATSLTEFELKKILLDKIQNSKSYRAAQEHKDLYDALVKSYKLDKDLFESYGKAYSLKRDCEDKDKDEDLLAGSDQGLKKQKTSKDAEPLKGSKSKESNSSSSKGTKSQTKSSGKSAQVEESVFESADIKMPLNQGSDLGNTDDQPNIEPTSRDDWFKKLERPPTLDSD